MALFEIHQGFKGQFLNELHFSFKEEVRNQTKWKSSFKMKHKLLAKFFWIKVESKKKKKKK